MFTKHATTLPFLTLGLLLCGANLAGCATDRAVINQADDVHQGIEPAVMEDSELTNYLQSVGNRIITAGRDLDAQDFGPKSHQKEDSAWMFSRDMRFHLVNSETLNAFTTGGEHMYIYNGLFQQCDVEDEMAAVMAHEYAHVYARHVHKGMDRQYAIIGGALAAGAAGVAVGGEERGGEYGATFAGAALAAGQFIGMGYTREDEAEADRLGFMFYTRAGWDPQLFSGFFKKMIAKGLDTTPAIASDHPTLASRVEAVDKMVRELPAEARSWRKPPVADAGRFRQLQARSAQLAKSMPKDKTLEGAQQLLAAFSNCILPVEQPEQVRARQNVIQQRSR